MNRYAACCRHTPALKINPGFREFFFCCTTCGAAGPPGGSADQAKRLWRANSERCIVYDTRGAARNQTAPSGGKYR